jgi:hypothetical protein
MKEICPTQVIPSSGGIRFLDLGRFPLIENSTLPGVNIMITILVVFRQKDAFLKTNDMTHFFSKNKTV